MKDTIKRMKETKVPILEEFKKFIAKGNVLDLAVGVVMATAFGAITTNLVNNVIMPLVGILIGGIDFSTLSVTMTGFNGQEVVMQYGLFIQAVVNFFIIALSVFLLVRILTARKRKLEAEAAKAAAEKKPEPPKPTNEELLLTEIRDLLREQNRK
ncbi:MAG: large-conductance mechanosensitive channel protein MscL [Clostridiaceae bacterium]|nr:large-conductance mechanosensitive channel protein MscL [Clostridiaceae bacterium]